MTLVAPFMSLALIAKKDPPIINALYKYKHQVFKDGALSIKEKELIAVSISCILKCEKCLEVHSQLAKDHGATKDELREAMEVAMYLAGPHTVIWSPMVDEIINDD
jgi:AhpD family alkylhydroperoxidase